jgi:hypothetical protein
MRWYGGQRCTRGSRCAEERDKQNSEYRPQTKHGPKDAPTPAGVELAGYPGLEIIAKLATVLEVDPAELLRVPAAKGGREGYG